MDRKVMVDELPEALAESLRRHNQTHLVKWWNELTADQRTALADQFSAVDFARIEQLILQHTGGIESAESPQALAARATPPENVVGIPATEEERAMREAAIQRGNELLSAGRVGAILVAGGQGTRLGFPHPKGMFPIGPLSDRSLFQLFAEQLIARSRRAGMTIPLYVMTSRATHSETVAFFRKHAFFGLDESAVRFFLQGSMPAVDAATGRILLADKHSIALSPDGHGGMLEALRNANLFAEMQRRGVDLLFYFQVDNPAAVVCDPAFLGYHDLRNADVSIKVASKSSAEERMGVVVQVDGTTRILEYSDFPADIAAELDSDGQLRFRGGNTAIHVFSRQFLESCSAGDSTLPFHVARKTVSFFDEAGDRIEPSEPNAWKFERFIFDLLPRAERTLVMEIDRATEFLPVKNHEGNDSPATARDGLIQRDRAWLQSAGVTMQEDVPVEISPLYALDADDLHQGISDGFQVNQPTVFRETGPETIPDVPPLNSDP